MSRIWTDLSDGQMGVPPVQDASEEFGPGAVLINTSRIPDVVRMPAGIGGRVLRVLGRTAFTIRCPGCGQERKCDGYELEDRYAVGVCPGCRNYNWVRR
jgi:hypothetical protein